MLRRRTVGVLAAPVALIFVTAWFARLGPRGVPRSPGQLIAATPVLQWESQSGAVKDEKDLEVEFEVKNVGGSPVLIESVESTCGCAKPRVEPNRVPPGGVAKILVVASPTAVEDRVVQITLHTDSIATPTVPLSLYLSTNRKPPYINRVFGDLTFSGSTSEENVRHVFVEAVEPKEAAGSPRVELDLGFLRAELVDVAVKRDLTASNTVLRTYRYKVAFAGPPPDYDCFGQASVVDPRNLGQRFFMPINVTLPKPIRIAPARLVLNMDEGLDPSDGETFMVTTREADASLEIEAENGETTPLAVRLVASADSGRVNTFRVRFREDRPPTPGVHNLVARSPKNADKPILIPILVRVKAKP